MKRLVILILAVLCITSCTAEQPPKNISEKNDSLNEFNRYQNVNTFIQLAQHYVELRASGQTDYMENIEFHMTNYVNQGLYLEVPLWFGITKDGNVITLLSHRLHTHGIIWDDSIDVFRGVENELDILDGITIWNSQNNMNKIWVFDIFIDSVLPQKYNCDVIVNTKYHSNDIDKSADENAKQKKKEALGEYLEKYDIKYANNKTVSSGGWNYFLVETPYDYDEGGALPPDINAITINLNGEDVLMYHASEIMNIN